MMQENSMDTSDGENVQNTRNMTLAMPKVSRTEEEKSTKRPSVLEKNKTPDIIGKIEARRNYHLPTEIDE